jgi:hypothetical protein
MRKLLGAAAAILVPGLMFLNAWQGWRYERLSDEVAALEDRQRELLESNRNAIAEIARERSTDNVERRARELGLVTADPSQVTNIIVGSVRADELGNTPGVESDAGGGGSLDEAAAGGQP